MLTVVSRDMALERGFARYFTGEACKNGHVSERRTATRHCLDCVAAAKAAMRERLGDAGWRAKQQEWDVRYRDADPARKLAHSRKAALKLLAKDPEYYRDAAKAWRRDNRAKFYENQRRCIAKWRTENPIAAKIRDAATRATYRAKSAGTLSPHGLSIIVRRVWDRAAGHCEACKAATDLELDHIVAVFNGGTNDEGNLQFLCVPCNRSKGTRDHNEWLASQAQRMELRA